jgi:hypothetical protein
MFSASWARAAALLVCGCLSTVFASCSTGPEIGSPGIPVSNSTHTCRVNKEFQAAKDFFDAVMAAEQLDSRAANLKGVREVAVAVSISDDFVQNTYDTDCKNEFVQRLRGMGLTVREKSDVVIHLNIIGLWDESGITSTYWIEITVHQTCFLARSGKHYITFVQIWGAGRLGSAGRNVFSDAFAHNLKAVQDEFINDLVSVN